MSAGSEKPPATAAAAMADPSRPPFPLLVEEVQHEQHEEEVPHGGELELPTVDLESPGESLAAACRRLGVFRIANHGVPAELSARLFALARDLLAGAPFDDKQALPGYFWGTPALSALRVRDVNWVEGFHVPLLPVAAGQQHHGPTSIAAEELEELAREYGAHMARVARKVFDAMAGALGLDASRAAAYLAERDGFVRVYRYPPCPEAGHLGMEAHTDSSVLSVINQDLVGGLQVLHDGAWRDVAPGGTGVDGTLVVNLGDMARAISGDAFRSVLHRVAASHGAERMSLCYFAFPRDDAVITGGDGSSAAGCGAGMGRSSCWWSPRRRRSCAEGTPWWGTRRGQRQQFSPGLLDLNAFDTEVCKKPLNKKEISKKEEDIVDIDNYDAAPTAKYACLMVLDALELQSEGNHHRAVARLLVTVDL